MLIRKCLILSLQQPSELSTIYCLCLTVGETEAQQGSCPSIALRFWRDFSLRKILRLPQRPPQEEVHSSGRVGSPKPHRPPTFHLGSDSATGRDSQHRTACLRGSKPQGGGSLVPVLQRGAGRSSSVPARRPQSALQRATSPPGAHTRPLSPSVPLMLRQGAPAGLWQAFCLPSGNLPSPSFCLFPAPCPGLPANYGAVWEHLAANIHLSLKRRCREDKSQADSCSQSLLAALGQGGRGPTCL